VGLEAGDEEVEGDLVEAVLDVKFHKVEKNLGMDIHS
jgi:hypothetical protein